MGKVFGGVKKAWGVGRRAVEKAGPVIGGVARGLSPFLGQITEACPEAAAAITAADALFPEKTADSGGQSFAKSYGQHMSSAMAGMSDKFQQFRNHPMVQNFTSTPAGKSAIGQIKNSAIDVATRLGISPAQQRNVVDRARSFTAGVQKISNPPARTMQYRTPPRAPSRTQRPTLRGAPVPNSMSQNIGLYGQSYFFHFW